MCWQTTDAFHKLYQKSKEVQERFLNPLIKAEPEAIILWQSNPETHFIEEPELGLGPVKEETNLGEIASESSCQLLF